MSKSEKRPAYRVETERTVIRCWSLTDARLRRAALNASDSHLRPWIPWMKDEPQTLHETAEWIRRTRANFDLDKDYRYAIFDREERELLGETGLYPRAGEGAREIGYWIDKRSEGHGYATETSAAMVRVAFEIDRIDRLEILCAQENAPSAAIPAKLGFTHEGNLKRRIPSSEGGLYDAMIWTLFASDYPESQASKIPISAFDCLGERLIP